MVKVEAYKGQLYPPSSSVFSSSHSHHLSHSSSTINHPPKLSLSPLCYLLTMVIFHLKLVAIAAAVLLSQAPSVLAAPSPAETLSPSVVPGPDATPLNLPTGPSGSGDADEEVHIIDGEVVNSTDHRLLARQNLPGIRLMNCPPIFQGGPGAVFKWTSLVVWCDNLGQCNDPMFVPSHLNVCIAKESYTEDGRH